MKREVNTHEAKTKLSRLLKRVAAGKKITIANRRVPVARSVPVRARKPERQLAAYGATIQIADDFDAPLADELLDLFDGGVKSTARKR
jgi:prevent-host-death family protein